MFNPNRLTPEERQMYEDMLYDAIILPDGSNRPTIEAGQRLFDALDHAADTYEWAHELIAVAARKSLGTTAKEWAKSQELIDTPFGQRTVTKSARLAVKRRNKDGARVDQLTLWEAATTADLTALINRNSQMRDGLEVDISIAVKLLQLCQKHGVENVHDALNAEGTDLQSYLGRAETA